MSLPAAELLPDHDKEALRQAGGANGGRALALPAPPRASPHPGAHGGPPARAPPQHKPQGRPQPPRGEGDPSKSWKGAGDKRVTYGDIIPAPHWNAGPQGMTMPQSDPQRHLLILLQRLPPAPMAGSNVPDADKLMDVMLSMRPSLYAGQGPSGGPPDGPPDWHPGGAGPLRVPTPPPRHFRSPPPSHHNQIAMHAGPGQGGMGGTGYQGNVGGGMGEMGMVMGAGGHGGVKRKQIKVS
ncbi:hypothetical protein CYMTET_12009 [Cymbomonas tetramitiformis]|uniref:Uncharacterized protein n=1 Tax=Cymbomonas tetramitiformis TaxID=36881 RepID=A0AAE0LCK6_9CHLO|nr:hypothetical protein CYMTET_12009 [Cymbomonas tetramitiformis]